MGVEKFSKVIGAMNFTRRILQTESAPITVGIRDSIDLRRIGAKTKFIRFHLARKTQG
jgi:hypothetical protein